MGKQNKSRKPANDGFSATSKTGKAAGNKKTSISVICMVLVLALFVGVIVYSKVVDSGVFYRSTVSVSSENFKVNNAMLSYFFNSQYQNAVSSLQQMGVDTSVNLKNAQYSGARSWFDYLMEDVTVPQVEQILVLCEAAKAAGFELDEHQKEHIDEAIDSIKAMAKEYSDTYGGSEAYYIRNVYGYGVSIDDIRDAIELNQLAAAYSEHLTDSYEFTEDEWNTYYDENSSDFLVVDYVSYTYTADDFKEDEAETTAADTSAADTTAVDTAAADATETEAAESTAVAAGASDADETAAADTTAADTTAAEEEAKELSAEAQMAKDAANHLYQEMISYPDSAATIFDTNVRDHLTNIVYADDEDKDASVNNAMESTVSEAVANSETNDFLKFAFGEERDSDAFITEDDTNGKYTVYLIKKAPYREEYNTKNVRVIALSAAEGDDVNEACDAVLKEFEEGDKTEDAFAELAKTHSDDATAHENGGLYENQGETDLGVDELNEWLYSEDRKAGDYTHASNGEEGESETVFIVYYVGEGLTKWQRDVDGAMVSEAYAEDYDKLAETHKVTSDLTEAYKIPSQAGL